MNIDFFCCFCEIFGVLGYEYCVCDLIIDEIKGLFDDVIVDLMGLLLCK